MWKKTARLQLPPSARREEVAVMGPANRGRYFQPPWQVLITRITRKGGWVQRGIWGTGAGAPRTSSKLREREAPSLLPQAQSAGGVHRHYKILQNFVRTEQRAKHQEEKTLESSLLVGLLLAPPAHLVPHRGVPAGPECGGRAQGPPSPTAPPSKAPCSPQALARPVGCSRGSWYIMHVLKQSLNKCVS